jgi:hypothetical protein
LQQFEDCPERTPNRAMSLAGAERARAAIAGKR